MRAYWCLLITTNTTTIAVMWVPCNVEHKQPFPTKFMLLAIETWRRDSSFLLESVCVSLPVVICGYPQWNRCWVTNDAIDNWKQWNRVEWEDEMPLCHDQATENISYTITVVCVTPPIKEEAHEMRRDLY